MKCLRGAVVMLVPLLAPAISMGADSVKLERQAIRDPMVDNIVGATLLVPAGWRLEGGFQWLPQYSIAAALRVKVADPTTGASVEMLPTQQYAYPQMNMGGLAIQPGTNWSGSTLMPVPGSAQQYVENVMAPSGLLPDFRMARLVDVRELPKVTEAVQRSIPPQHGVTVKVTKLRYALVVEGKPWESDVYVTASFGRPNGAVAMWWASANIFRARAGQLDKLTPLLSVPTTTLRLTLPWTATLEQVRQIGAQGRMQEIINTQRLGEIARANREHAQQQWQAVYDERQATLERQNFAFRETLGNIETYRSPFESSPYRTVELPAGYKSYWTDRDGTVVISEDPGFDPRPGSTGDWRKMERYSP